MSDRDGWLERFAVANRSLPVIYWLGVASTIAGTVGILWSLPVPAEFLENASDPALAKRTHV